MNFVKVTGVLINLDRISEVCISKVGENFDVRISYGDVNDWSRYFLNEEELAKIEIAMGVR